MGITIFTPKPTSLNSIFHEHSEVCLYSAFLPDALRVTIERLDSLHIIIRKHEVAFASVGVDGKHECSWVLGVVQT